MSQMHTFNSLDLDREYAWRLETTKLERQRVGDDVEVARLTWLQQERAINKTIMLPSDYSLYVLNCNQREIEFNLERTRQARREAKFRNGNRNYPHRMPALGHFANARHAPVVGYPPIAGQGVPHIQALLVGQRPIAAQAAPTVPVPPVVQPPIAAPGAFRPHSQSLGGPSRAMQGTTNVQVIQNAIIHTAPIQAAPRTTFKWNVNADFRPPKQPSTARKPPLPPRLQPVQPFLLRNLSPPPLMLDESDDSGYYSLALSISSPKPRLDEDQLDDIEEWLGTVKGSASGRWCPDPEIWGFDVLEEFTPEWKWMPLKFR